MPATWVSRSSSLTETLVASDVMVRVIDLFREWDHDRNGGIDKKEMRRGLAALGYGFPKKEVDALFDSINEAGDGFIDFEDLKRALSGESGHAVARGR